MATPPAVRVPAAPTPSMSRGSSAREYLTSPPTPHRGDSFHVISAPRLNPIADPSHALRLCVDKGRRVVRILLVEGDIGHQVLHHLKEGGAAKHEDVERRPLEQPCGAGMDGHLLAPESDLPLDGARSIEVERVGNFGDDLGRTFGADQRDRCGHPEVPPDAHGDAAIQKRPGDAGASAASVAGSTYFASSLACSRVVIPTCVPKLTLTIAAQGLGVAGRGV